VTAEMEEGFPPLRIDADGLAGGHARYGAAESSQFLSAVCMVGPYARHECALISISRKLAGLTCR